MSESDITTVAIAVVGDKRGQFEDKCESSLLGSDKRAGEIGSLNVSNNTCHVTVSVSQCVAFASQVREMCSNAATAVESRNRENRF